MTPEEVHTELMEFKIEIQKLFGGFKTQMQKDFGDFKAEMLKCFGDFKTDLIKTIWLTQLSTIGVILIGVGLLLHFHL